MRKLIIIPTIVLLFSLFSTSAYCHKIRVFAYSEGDNIVGEASFNGGKKAKETTIIVTDQNSGEQLATVKTDSKGQFSFAIPETARQKQLNLLIAADAGEGHRNEWLLEAADYLPGVADQPAPQVSSTNSPDIPEPEPSPQAAAISEEQLRRIIDESIASQLGPVKRLLAESRDKKISLQDILGGLGYIIGLAGLAAFMKSRKGDTHDS